MSFVGKMKTIKSMQYRILRRGKVEPYPGVKKVGAIGAKRESQIEADHDCSTPYNVFSVII